MLRERRGVLPRLLAARSAQAWLPAALDGVGPGGGSRNGWPGEQRPTTGQR